MHSRLQNHTMHQRMSCTRWEETSGITSFSTSRLSKFHTGMHVHTYRTTATRYVRFSRRLGEFLEWMLISKLGTLSHDNTYSAPGAQTADQISAILRDQFDILPKRRMIGYTKPYPSDYDLIPLPPMYQLPEFTKFNGLEGSSSIEHVSRYLAQLGMISVSDPLRVRFFSQSLTGPAFGWYT
jgi:hypothetical protein